MTDGILLEEPLILICFGIALFLSVINKTMKNAASAAFTVICLSIYAFAFVWALLFGATMQELLIVAMIFFVIDLLSFSDIGKGDDT